MPFRELSLICRDCDAPRLEAALEDLGALAVTLLDAEAATPNASAILEPGVGETPLWSALRITALFPADNTEGAIAHALECAAPAIEWNALTFAVIADQDWTRAWMDQYQPMQFGSRLWVYPSNIDPEGLDAAAVVVRLDPGLAFGSGTHPTTALCLEWLESIEFAGESVLDFGCGSGILAIAALKLGAVHAVAVDNDPQALSATWENATRNAVANRIGVHAPDDAPQRHYPIVVANILAGALDALAERIAHLVEPAGRIALSGVLVGQEAALLEKYSLWFDHLAVVVREDWVRIDGVRKSRDW